MLVSVALLLLLGLLLGTVFQRLGLPRLLGYLITGILLGPYCLKLLSADFLSLSKDLRQIALIVILTRAGLTLQVQSLKKAGPVALFMCFLPATAEIVGFLLFAPPLLHFSFHQALLLGAILGAVSPAVVVPRMIHLIKEGYGVQKSIPQVILAGSSVDDVYVLVIFAAAIGLNRGEVFSLLTLLQVPIAILSGIALGTVVGYLLGRFFIIFKTRSIVQTLILLSLSFLLMALENTLKTVLPFSGMLAVMTSALFLSRTAPEKVPAMSHLYGQIWVLAELFLFALVGAATNIHFALANGVTPIVMLAIALLFRLGGVYLALLPSHQSAREKLFTMVAYCPKATVQAAIGSVPLSMGLAGGEMMLTVAVLSILITAPIGAFGIDRLAPICLKKSL